MRRGISKEGNKAMHNKGFEKETFKETVRENIKTLYRKTIDEATPQQIFRQYLMQ